MSTVGVVAEFNPFHGGHGYLAAEARNMTGADTVVAVMSGNFVQRGDPAVFDKRKRAVSAIEGGYDLVIELPTVFSCSSAGTFAKGGINILEGLGEIDYLAFGSESGDIERLKAAAFAIRKVENEHAAEIKNLVAEGISYPAARQAAIELFYGDFDNELISLPNNILALEYLLSIKSLKPVTIKREGKGHHESATEIRKAIYLQNEEAARRTEDAFFDLIRFSVLSATSSELEIIASAGEGLGNKLKNEIRYASSREDMIERLKSKRYTYTRLSRLLTQTVLGINKESISNAASYIKVLAFNERGAAFIRRLRKSDKCRLPFIDSAARSVSRNPEIADTLSIDIRANDIYNIITGSDLYEMSEYVQKPINLG